MANNETFLNEKRDWSPVFNEFESFKLNGNSYNNVTINQCDIDNDVEIRNFSEICKELANEQESLIYTTFS
jgi:hypothetical protein